MANADDTYSQCSILDPQSRSLVATQLNTDIDYMFV